MWHKRILFLLVYSCISIVNYAQELHQEKTDRHPYIPSKSELMELCEIDYSELNRVVKVNSDDTTKYYLGKKLYSGWACSIDLNNKHKYRYKKFSTGILVRDVGYYINGTLDFDFYLNEQSGIRSHRMWREDGTKYIDHYYTSKDNMHGMQYTWHAGNKLARKALFNHGTMIYDIYYDIDGNITKQLGKVPD